MKMPRETMTASRALANQQARENSKKEAPGVNPALLLALQLSISGA
jgi:hypothetical protein